MVGTATPASPADDAGHSLRATENNFKWFGLDPGKLGPERFGFAQQRGARPSLCGAGAIAIAFAVNCNFGRRHNRISVKIVLAP